MKTRHSIVLVLALATGMATTLVMPSLAEAQRERRREFVENLLEGLIESQLGNPSGENAAPRPGQNVRPGQPGRTVAVPAEVQTARSELEHISTSMRNLVNALQNEAYSIPAYRQPLAEAMQIKAMCDGLYHNSVYFTDLRQMAQGYAEVDRLWRQLSHSIHQATGVNRSVLAITDEIDSHTTEMNGLLGSSPQLDRTELIRLSSALTTEISHLLDDLAYELRGNPRQHQLLTTGRDLQTRIRQSIALVDRGDYDSIVAAWQQGQAGWRPFAMELRRMGSDRLQRDVTRIEQTGRRITEALLLPLPMDREYISHLASSIETDISHIMESITLQDILASRDAPRLLAAASELQNTNHVFRQAVAGTGRLEDLVWDYRIFGVAWQDFTGQCRQINNPEVTRHLQTGSESMALLEQTMGGGIQLSQREIQQMVSELGQLANRTALFVNQNIAPAAHYDYRLRNEIQQQAGGMQSSVRHILTHMTDRVSEQQAIREDLDEAIGNWQQLKTLMGQCRESDQRQFRALRRQLEPLFVKLQVVYSK